MINKKKLKITNVSDSQRMLWQGGGIVYLNPGESIESFEAPQVEDENIFKVEVKKDGRAKSVD